MGGETYVGSRIATRRSKARRAIACGMGSLCALTVLICYAQTASLARDPSVVQGPVEAEPFPPSPSIIDSDPPAVAWAGVRLPDSGAVLPPWRRYASIVRVQVGQPAVAIVIDDLGSSVQQLERVLAIDPALTLSFLPSGADTPGLVSRAQREGHDVLLHIPMEPDNPHLDPGKDALRVGASERELRRILVRHLDRFSSYVGINNHMGSRFTRDLDAMRVVLDELKARGLMFLDSRTTLGSQAPRLAETLGLPFAERNVFIDSDREPDAIAFQLARLERTARQGGTAVAIAHPHEMTLDALRAWLPAARARGLAIVPISYVAAQRCAC